VVQIDKMDEKVLLLLKAKNLFVAMKRFKFIGSKSKNSGMEIEDYVLTATEREAARMEKPLERQWFEILWWMIVVMFFILAGRVVFLTVLRGAHYQEVARGNSIRSIIISAPRGRILDRNGGSLVTNVPSMDVVAIPADLPHDSEGRNKLVENLAKILSLNEGDIFARFENTESQSIVPLLLKENISQEEYLILSERGNDFPGIIIDRTAIRDYVDSKIFSHIIGYEGKIERKEIEENPNYLLTDYIGKQGVEKSYEKDLRGVHGAVQVEVDSKGEPKRQVGIINPVPGSDLLLSIDGGLQRKLYESLDNILKNTNTRTAAAVAINPQNGEVLALVNLPSYDNNVFARKISSQQYAELINDPDKPLFNRAVAGEYAPGSTVKPAMASAALSEGTINQSTIIDGLGGTLRVGSFSFGDWKAHGPSDVRTAIAESNDIFFYTIGGGYGSVEGLGMTRMKKYYNLFGFGMQTGIDIGGESDGFIPDEQWKLDKLGERWYVGNSYHASIGQGYVTATPLQIANYIAAVANGGILYKPHLVKEVRGNSGKIKSIDPQIIRQGFISSSVMKVVQEGMRKTITDGTAQTLKDLPVAVAGKTGTAQFGSEDKTHAWFVSYAPFDNPQIAMVVLVEGGGEGHSSAVPVTKEVYQWYFEGRK